MLAKKESSLSSFPCSFTEPSSQICSNIIRCCWWSSHLAVSAPHLAVSAPYKWLFMHRANRPLGASLVAQMVKNLPIMLKAWVWSLGQEDPLEEGMTTNCSILAWRIPWTEELGTLPCVESNRVGCDWAHTHAVRIYEELWSWAKCWREETEIFLVIVAWKTDL